MPRTTVRRGHFLRESLIIEAGITEADIGLAGNRSAVANQTILSHALFVAKREGRVGLAQAHRIAVVGVGGDVKAVALAEQAGVVVGRRLFLEPPLFPGVFVGRVRDRRRVIGMAEQVRFAAGRRSRLVGVGKAGYAGRQCDSERPRSFHDDNLLVRETDGFLYCSSLGGRPRTPGS